MLLRHAKINNKHIVVVVVVVLGWSKATPYISQVRLTSPPYRYDPTQPCVSSAILAWWCGGPTLQSFTLEMVNISIQTEHSCLITSCVSLCCPWPLLPDLGVRLML